jgi:hypothetical protein
LRAASTDEAMAALASGKEPETDDAPLNLITAAREFTAQGARYPERLEQMTGR